MKLSMKQVEEEKYQRFLQEVDKKQEDNDIPPANVVISGATGVGKSTLLNAVFGDKVDKADIGRSQTKEIKEYQNDGIPIHIWDTVGFELSEDGKRTAENFNAISQIIMEKNKSNDSFDRIHAIWYCVNAAGNRFQDAEAKFVASLAKLGVPFIIVITQCISPKKDKNFEDKIKESIKEHGVPGLPVIQVLAEEYEVENPATEEIIKIPSKGLDALIELTINNMPEYLKESFVAAQRVSKVDKHKMAVKLIVDEIRDTEKDFWSKVVIARIFDSNNRISKLFLRLANIYNATILTKKAINDICHYSTKDIKKGTLRDFWSFKKELNNELENILKAIQVDGEIFTDLDDMTELENSLTDGVKMKLVITVDGFRFMKALEEVWDEATEAQLQNINFLVNALREKMAASKSRNQ